MSYNFKEALKGLNDIQYIEEDAEKVLKLVVEKAKETRIAYITALNFCLVLEDNEYYIYATLHNEKKQGGVTESIKMLDRNYACAVIHRIRDILEEQGFSWIASTEEFNKTLSKREKKIYKYIKCYSVLGL